MSITQDAIQLKKLFEVDDPRRDPFPPVSSEDLENRKTDAQKREEAEQKRKEEKREADRQAHVERATGVYNRLKVIVGKLGMSVSPDSQEPAQQGYYSGAYFVDALRNDGARLRLRVGSRSPTMITVTGSYYKKSDDPDYAQYSGFRNRETPPAINISLSKSDDQITKDIARRILSKFDDSINQAEKRIAGEISQLQAKRKMVADTVKILGLSGKYYDDEIKRGNDIRKYFSNSSMIDSFNMKPSWTGDQATVSFTVKAEAVPSLMKKLKGLITL